MIDLVKTQVEQLEKENQSWIIEGFPRTKVQALALQKLGIIPDRFILLNVDKEQIIEKVDANLVANNTLYPKEERYALGEQAIKEYEMHMKQVKSAFKHFIIEHDATGKS